jgi:hypothetical protein
MNWARNWIRLRSPGIDSKKSILPAFVAWDRICKRIRSPGIDSKDSIPPTYVAWNRICKRLRSPRIYSRESIPSAYVAWRACTSNRVFVPARLAGNRFWLAGTTTPFVIDPWGSLNVYKFGLSTPYIYSMGQSQTQPIKSMWEKISSLCSGWVKTWRRWEGRLESRQFLPFGTRWLKQR